MVNMCKGLAIVAASAGLLLASSNGALAATQAFDFEVSILDGPLLGDLFTGTLSFDDTSLTNLGSEIIGVDEGLAVNFSYLGSDFTEADDFSFPFFPTVEFSDGEILSLNYFVQQADGSSFEFATDPVVPESEFNYITSDFQGGLGAVTYSGSQAAGVPEPISLAGILLVGSMLGAGSVATKRNV
ncbi:MAG: PEP-CTERM sorting domain-containing protein [Cyanobacteria bacterium P01_F01_bin.116]